MVASHETFISAFDAWLATFDLLRAVSDERACGSTPVPSDTPSAW